MHEAPVAQVNAVVANLGHLARGQHGGHVGTGLPDLAVAVEKDHVPEAQLLSGYGLAGFVLLGHGAGEGQADPVEGPHD